MSNPNATRCLLVARASPAETRAEPLPLFLARVLPAVAIRAYLAA